MSQEARSRLVKLRAFCAAVCLLIAAVSAPVALATRSADVCGMACCVKDGRCCCSPRHANVRGKASDDKPHIGDFEVSSSCPQECASPIRSSNLILRDHRRGTFQHAAIAEPALVYDERVARIHDLVLSGSSPPRAPPAYSIL